jgi:hypothetical protein
MKRYSPPSSPNTEPKGSVKLNKVDEDLLLDIQKEKERIEKEQHDRFEGLRVPLHVPTQEEIDVILPSIRSAIVKEPYRIFSFILKDPTDGMYFDNDSSNWDFLWLKRPNQWLLDYKDVIPEDPSDRHFASNYVQQQLHAYFKSISDAWNAKYSAIQLVPQLSSSYCGFETIHIK